MMDFKSAQDEIRACVAFCGGCDRDTENGPCHAEEKAFIKGYRKGREWQREMDAKIAHEYFTEKISVNILDDMRNETALAIRSGILSAKGGE